MDNSFRASLDTGKVILFSPETLVIRDTAVSFRGIVRALIDNKFKDIIFDMSRCRYVDSSGIGELVSSYTICNNVGGSLVLNNLPRRIQDLLMITKLLTVFQTFEVDYSKYPYFEISPEDLTALKRIVSSSQLDALNLLLTLQNGRIQILPGLQDGIYRISLEDNPKSEIVIASPYVIANITRSYIRDEIEEFEALVNSPLTKEHEIQKFIEDHPKFLLGQEYQELYPQIVLEREEEGPLIPDFLIKPFDKNFCDVVDLKLPSAPLIVGGQNRKRFSSAIADAAAQLRTYRDYFDDPTRREFVKTKYGITAFRPKLAVVVGRASELDSVLYKQIQNGLQGVEVMTYDDLIKRARNFLLL